MQEIDPLFFHSYPALKNKNLLIFSGFFGCSTICPKNFQLALLIGEKFSENLQVIFLNVDPLLEDATLRENCKQLFGHKVQCFSVTRNDFQNFFRNLGLPIYRAKNEFEHSSKFLLYRNSDQKFFVLENPKISEMEDLLYLNF